MQYIQSHSAQLSAVDRSQTPFVIVSGHRPLYTSSLHSDEFGAGLIQHVQPLLLKHRVDVYLAGKFFFFFFAGIVRAGCPLALCIAFDLLCAGHVHAYERSCVLNGPGACALSTADGFVHIVAGMAGNDYQVSWANSKCVCVRPLAPRICFSCRMLNARPLPAATSRRNSLGWASDHSTSVPSPRRLLLVS